MNKLLIDKYFEKHSLVEKNLDSFNDFIEWRLQKIIDSIGSATPAVIPPDVEEVKFVFGKVKIDRPYIIEADGAERAILPTEARLRNLTYASPVFLEISTIVDGKERERAEVQITELPIMIKSKLCYLSNMDKEELIKSGEDPLDFGGYFIINGTERVLVLLEDLAQNRIFVNEEKIGPSTHTAKIFSANNTYKIPHILERSKDGLYLTSFTNINKLPLVVLMKALGLTNDSEIIKAIGLDDIDEDMYINLYEFVDIKNKDDAKEFIGRLMKIPQPKEQKIQRVDYMIDNFLLPHVGSDPKSRLEKAFFLGRIAKKILLLKQGKIKADDKDHYSNKRIRLAGDLLEDLFRTNIKILVSDMLYIFQRSVRRGKMPSLHTIVRTKLLTSRIKSAMATGNWTGNRQGVSQRLQRDNQLESLSQLQRVVSLLVSSQENFEARALHPTHWGKLCPIESPEGKNIGLRKNLSLLSEITPLLGDKEINRNMEYFKSIGLKDIKNE